MLYYETGRRDVVVWTRKERRCCIEQEGGIVLYGAGWMVGVVWNMRER